MRGAWTISLRKRTSKPFSLRSWVLVTAACGALVAPGVARAASSPPGVADVTTAVNSAFAQVDAVAPGAGASAQAAVDQALAAASTASELAGAQTSTMAAATDSAAPTPVAAPASAAADAVAPALAAAGVPATAPAPAQEAPTVPRRVEESPAPAVAPFAARPRGTLGRFPHIVLGTGTARTAASLTIARASAGPSSTPRSSRPARSSGTAPAGASSPRPLPPVPPAPGPAPGLTSPIQAGGQGSFAPLLVVALAAALALASFPFSSRLLPKSAFRKPRRVVIAVWHPG